MDAQGSLCMCLHGYVAYLLTYDTVMLVKHTGGVLGWLSIRLQPPPLLRHVPPDAFYFHVLILD